MKFREQILYYSYRYDGDWKKIKKAIMDNESWKRIETKNHYITILDKEYPAKLRNLEFPPWILFYEGNLTLCETPIVAIIGSRMATTYGLEACKTISNILKQRYTIISGLAKGIDSEAHKAALTRHTIAVIGCGLDIYYPRINMNLQKQIAQDHLVLSEYPPHVKPLAFHFPWRNRIIAALSQGIIVVEASMHSGTMLTVNEGLALDIPIYCVPHLYDNEKGKGGNYLIAQGAQILIDEQDIMMI